jgi:hypothetical protein
MMQLEQVPCEHGQILMDADSSLNDVFFPDSGVSKRLLPRGQDDLDALPTATSVRLVA